MTKAIILNTRPVSLQESTHGAFNEYGFEMISLPCIEIAPAKNVEYVIQQLQSLKPHDILIFTSQYAVKYSYCLFSEINIPKSSHVITVGSKTAHALENNYTGHIWTPHQQNSKGVIDLLKGLKNCRSIKLITAAKGRKLIQTYAKDNNIECEQINVYQRQLPVIDDDIILKIKQIQPLYILATSETTLINLKILAKDCWNHLLKQTVLCASERIQCKAYALGFENCRNMHTANPQKMAQKLSKTN